MKQIPATPCKTVALAITAAALAPLVAARMAAACPMCKELLFDPGQIRQNLSMAKGYAIAIGLMLGIPALLVTTIALLLIRAKRRAAPGAAIGPAARPFIG